MIIQHISYNKLEAVYDTDIFTEPTMKGRLGVNALPVKKHLYDHVLYDSTNEKTFATGLDTSEEVAVYIKLPNGFYINTPVGKYNPDWANRIPRGNGEAYLYFVAGNEGIDVFDATQGYSRTTKIHCAREHFKSISTENLKYDIVDSYEILMNKVLQ